MCGKGQFHIKLEMDKNSEDGYRHPPAVFSIGADRGFLVYAGQPQACRRCGSTGHEAEQCWNCNDVGHSMRDCTELKRCHLCESEEYMARDCTKDFLIYAGQTLCCRKCGGKGHDAEHCDQVRCRSCNSMGHSTRDCTEPKRCHLCESEEHMARDCTKEAGADPSTGEAEGHAPKGTQTECMHAPLSVLTSENEMEDGSETAGNSDKFIIRTLFSQESLGK
uniref:CCHC-type domain-containing protein n=1 Tax=Oreochromis niloticus TaxID=8128 RepID=A0A669CNT7_ORENI